jgi:hypothetical protein
VLFTDLLRRLIQSAVNASTRRRLSRLKSTESQTDSVEDLQLLLAPDSKAQRRGAGLLVDHYTADTATQCDLLGIVNAVPLRANGYLDNIVQLAASGDTSTGTTHSAESPITRSRRAGAQVCCFASIPHSMSTSGQHSAAHFGLSGCKEPGHKRRMSARHLAYD